MKEIELILCNCQNLYNEDLSTAITTNTKILNEALSKDNEATQIIISSGVYVVGTIYFSSNKCLYLKQDSVLSASENILDYGSNKENNEKNDHENLNWIIANNCNDISIKGEGVLEGNGYSFWTKSVRSLAEEGKKISADLEYYFEEDSNFYVKNSLRVSPLIDFRDCTNVKIEGITIKNSPGWTIHLMRCSNIKIKEINILNDLYGPNTDGIDINGCSNVFITGCKLTTGDDSIIIKASKDAAPTSYVCVSDCIIETNCAAIGIGAEVDFPIRNISFSNIVVRQALRMFQIELWSDSIVENVFVNGLIGDNLTDIPLERPLYIDVQKTKTGTFGKVRNVNISNVIAYTRGRCLFTATDESSISNLILDKINLNIVEFEDPYVSVSTSRSKQMSNSNPFTRLSRAAFVFDNVKRFSLLNSLIVWPDECNREVKVKQYSIYDHGQLKRDKRKQASLLNQKLSYDAIILRRCCEYDINSPLITAFGGEIIRKLEE